MAETTQRVLRLLSLLQSRAEWSGPELATRLGVTIRTVRRDVDRLRSLGYPVMSTQGPTGGYRLGAGRSLPPLLLDDEEAVAVAVSLRLAGGGTVAGTGEAALRALAKLDQVMPPGLRSEVRAVQQATAVLPGGAVEVDGEVLLVLARACRDAVQVRFGYAARDGSLTERRVEPQRLVATGRRWYLMGWDLDREDWRTFRLDRMREVAATTWRTSGREHPDPVDFVQRAVSTSAYRFHATVRVQASAEEVRSRVTPASATVTATGPDECVLEAGGDDLESIALHLAWLGLDFEVLAPPALQEATLILGRRLVRAAGHDGAGHDDSAGG